MQGQVSFYPRVHYFQIHERVQHVPLNSASRSVSPTYLPKFCGLANTINEDTKNHQQAITLYLLASQKRTLHAENRASREERRKGLSFSGQFWEGKNHQYPKPKTLFNLYKQNLKPLKRENQRQRKMFASENGLKGDPRLKAISEAIRVVPHFPKPGSSFCFLFFQSF